MPVPGRSLLPTSLTGRLVATLVLVVVLSSALVAVLTSVAMRGVLYSQLDTSVDQALGRSVGRFGAGFVPGGPAGVRGGDPGGDPGGDRGAGRADDGAPLRFGIGDAAGTLAARLGEDPVGRVVTGRGDERAVSAAALAVLDTVPADGEVHGVELPAAGSFRVKVADGPDGVRLAVGVSTRQADSVVARLVLWELLLTIGALALAAVAGRYLVRRQLRPLRQVAAAAHQVADLPLSTGAIGTTVRVPDDLTDERTEVGAVGAALNAMLAHVERSLDDRHRSEQQVRQFVADASHELRTPLSTIHGYAELTRRTGGDPEQLALAMSRVESEATRMSSLVEDLLLLARLDAGRPLARDEVDVTRLALETVGDARVVAPDHHWSLDLPEEPVVVPGDEQRLHQVVTNLLTNAHRHTPAGTSVRIRVREVPAGPPGSGAPTVVVSVEDDGPGMSAELVAAAFERFTRGDSSRTRASGGAGLGLSLVQAIAAAHGGSVSVSSRPGRTSFDVCLPGPGATATG